MMIKAAPPVLATRRGKRHRLPVPTLPPISTQIRAKRDEYVTAQDLLLGKTAASKRALVVGGGMVGCEATEYLAERGHQVAIVEMKDVIAADVTPENRRYMFRNFEENHVLLQPGAKVTRFYADGVDYALADGAAGSLRGYDTVVLAMGSRSNAGLKETAGKVAGQVLVIGEAAKATGISGAIAALLSVVLTALGFLEQNALGKANSYGILSFALTLYIFDGLKDCTPQMLGQIIRPTLVLVIVGVIGLGVVSFIAAKVMKCSAPLAYATCLTALYGFPFNVVMTESACEALTEDTTEREYLKGQMLPPMLVGGFTTVTIASVVIAGIFVKLL